MLRGHDPVIVALDVGDREILSSLSEALAGEVETVKVGLQLYTCLGPEVLDDLRSKGFRVFVDLKLHDIPNTVEKAMKALVKRHVDMITVHISGGREMLRAAVRAAREQAEASGIARPAVLGVTLLTSLDEHSAREVGWVGTTQEQVLTLARLGVSCGLDGLVCSAREAATLRKELGPEPVIVTPAIRMTGGPEQDQARVTDPAAALSSGADYLVVGRTVIQDPDPRSALWTLRRSAGLGVELKGEDIIRRNHGEHREYDFKGNDRR
jgi:orotidine-5'-phosphate decarboxylase